jgi:hypothetical protein
MKNGLTAGSSKLHKMKQKTEKWSRPAAKRKRRDTNHYLTRVYASGGCDQAARRLSTG